MKRESINTKLGTAQVAIMEKLDMLQREGFVEIVFTQRGIGDGNDPYTKMHTGGNKVASATRSGNQVMLILAEPENQEDLNEWGCAIAKAVGYINEVQYELRHEADSPNFFKAVRARVLNHKWLSL